MSQFDFTSTASDVVADIDLTGRTAFITGGYSGLGMETARAMAGRGAHVVIAGRDAAKAQESAAEIGNGAETIVCDLGDLAQIARCGAEARERFGRIDLLINNAGIMATPFGTTADGFEQQFGINHLGHFALTAALMPLVLGADAPRIVNLSSRAHFIAPVDLDDPHFEHRAYEKWASYGQSKTANALFTVGLHNRFAARGVDAFAVHPGGIATNLGRHMDDADTAALMERLRRNAQAAGQEPEPFKTPEQGAATTCWAATVPELAGHGGQYAENCGIAAVTATDTMRGVRPYALDPDAAERLWTMSEQATGIRFPD